MEELIDFLIDVFSNVWRKLKLNMTIVIAGGVIASVLFIPYFYKICPLLSLSYIFIRILIISLLFIFIKAYVLTINEIKINANTYKTLFQNLLNPCIFTVAFFAVFGLLAFIASVPFIYQEFTEKFYVIAFAVSIISAIVGLALLPNALLSLFFSYEGKNFKEAIIAGNQIMGLGRGKMYALMISLLLCTLVLNLTYIGMIIVFPLFMLSMNQARESIIKIEEEKKIVMAEKQNKQHYRPKVDFTKDYPSKDYSYNDYDVGKANAKTEDAANPPQSPQPAVQPAPQPAAAGPETSSLPDSAKENTHLLSEENLPQEPAVLLSEEEAAKEQSQKDDGGKTKDFKPVLGLGNIFIAGRSADKPAQELNPKMVSRSEYVAPPEEIKEEDMSLSDFIDFGLYESKVKENGGEETEAAAEKAEMEKKVEIEIEPGGAEKNIKPKKEAKSGKAYIDEFGTIARKQPAKSKNYDEKRKENAKEYIENFGIIERKNK